MGERKYHVQFFKLTSASPLSVRTRMRCLPHVQQPSSSRTGGSSSSGSGGGSSNTDQQHSDIVTAVAAAAAGTRCFLEVSVENSTSLPLVLHAVRLLTPAGIAAQQLTICEQHQQQQDVQQWHKPRLGYKDSSNSSSSGGGGNMRDQNSSSSGNDTQLIHDITTDASFVHHNQQQQQHEQKQLSNSLQQLHLTQQQQQQQQQPLGSGLGPLLQGFTEPLVVVPPAGSHNYLWQVDHQHLPAKVAAAAAAAAAAAPAGSNDTAAPGTPTRSSSSSSSSSSSVGRLELHWSNFEGKTGRLLTQPLSTLAAGWHRDVLMQLTKLQPAAAAGSSSSAVSDQAGAKEQQQFAEYLVAGEPVVATFTLTAATAVHQHASGALLVLYSELPLATPSSIAAAQQQQEASTTDSSSSLQRRQSASSSGPSSSSGSSSNSTVHPDVAVQGSRIQRVHKLQPGQTASVSFVLLPLRRGWVRLPTFMVVSEVDGRLLDSVREVQVLVV
jgi:hypothetical protein